MNKVEKIVDTIILVLISTVSSIMIISIFLQVVFRYLFSNPLFWSEELARYCFVYIVFLGGAWSGKKLSHLGVDYFISKLPKNIVKLITVFIYITIILFSLLITLVSFPVIRINMRQFSPALEVPMGLVYLAIPIGFVFTAIYYALRLFDLTKFENQEV